MKYFYVFLLGCLLLSPVVWGVKVSAIPLLPKSSPALSETSTPAGSADPKKAVIIQLACKKKDCTGFCLRVCNVAIIDDYENMGDIPFQPNQGGGVFTHFADNDQLSLTLRKEWLGSAFAENYLQQGSFRLEEDYELPSELYQSLNFKQPYTIQKGDYPFTEYSDRYEINL
jgi:hypothetical protein